MAPEVFGDLGECVSVPAIREQNRNLGLALKDLVECRGNRLDVRTRNLRERRLKAERLTQEFIAPESFPLHALVEPLVGCGLDEGAVPLERRVTRSRKMAEDPIGSKKSGRRSETGGRRVAAPAVPGGVVAEPGPDWIQGDVADECEKVTLLSTRIER